MNRIRKSPTVQYSVQVRLPGGRAPGVEAVCGELQADRIMTERMTRTVLVVFIPAPSDEPIPGAHFVHSRPDIWLRVGTGVLRAEFCVGQCSQVDLVSARFLFLEGLMRLSINAKGG